MTETLAWHFIGATLRDKSPIPADNVPLKFDGDLIICQSGLHAAERIFDALSYAPGHTICRVKCSGIGERQNDKFVCSERTILWRIDGEQILRQFSRRVALDVIHLWDAARAAAWAAAWDASIAKYNDWLTEMVEAAHAATRDIAEQD